MSNSLNINVQNPIKQNTPLRGVPSGSTREPDYSVKYVEQSLTDAQKAQARQNIGAAADGQGGGATVNEFHYKRDTSTDPVSFYIDAPDYTPTEGDLMVVIFDWTMDPTKGCTIRNGSTDIPLDLRNAPVSQNNYYDDVYGTVNTRWTVKLEKDQSDNWHAYNINTIEFPDWNVNDANAVGYIKNKPTIPESKADLSHCIIGHYFVNTTTTFTNNHEYNINNVKQFYFDGNPITETDLSGLVVSAGYHTLAAEIDYNLVSDLVSNPRQCNIIFGTQNNSLTYTENRAGVFGFIRQNAQLTHLGVARPGKTVISSDQAYVRGTICDWMIIDNCNLSNFNIDSFPNIVITYTNPHADLYYFGDSSGSTTSNCYVPKGTAAAWRQFNPNTRITFIEYEYANLPEERIIIPYNAIGYSNNFYTINIPSFIFGQ